MSRARLANALLLPLATFCAFAGGWEALVRLFDVPKIVLPSPTDIALAFWNGLLSGDFIWHFAVTMYEILAGFALGAVFGLLLGFFIALVPLAERIFYPYVVAFQTVPKVAIAPITDSTIATSKPTKI